MTLLPRASANRIDVHAIVPAPPPTRDEDIRHADGDGVETEDTGFKPTLIRTTGWVEAVRRHS
jgi:hypothetical protein